MIANTIIENDLLNILATKTKSVSCQKEIFWSYGDTFMSYLKLANFTGLSGEISFNQKTNDRTNPVLYIVDVIKNGVDLVIFFFTPMEKSQVNVCL